MIAELKAERTEVVIVSALLSVATVFYGSTVCSVASFGSESIYCYVL
jgi:hypothetical protein